MEFRLFLLMILVGVFGSTVVIVVVFIIVNKCIQSSAAKYTTTSKNHTKSKFELSNTYKLDVSEDIRPPLPPRDQFDSESLTNSYEEMPDIPAVEVETTPLQDPDHSRPPDPHTNFLDNNSISESYDDVDALPNAVQGNHEEVASLPDYLQVDLPPFQNGSDNGSDNESDNGSENYDDVDQLPAANEDYDDVG